MKYMSPYEHVGVNVVLIRYSREISITIVSFL